MQQPHYSDDIENINILVILEVIRQFQPALRWPIKLRQHKLCCWWVGAAETEFLSFLGDYRCQRKLGLRIISKGLTS